MGKIEVTLDEETTELLHQVVENGEYKSVDDVIGGALLEWRMQRLSPEEVVELRRLVQEGIDSGDPRDGPKALAEIRAHIAALGTERDVR